MTIHRLRAFFLLPLLAACGSQGGAGGGGGGEVVDEAALSDENLLAETGGRQGPSVEELIATAMPSLVNPARARYRNVRSGIGGGACGEVSAPTGKEAAPFRPFLITPQGIAVISANTAVTFRDPADPFPDLYIRWCATPEELETLTSELKRGPVDGVLEAANTVAPPEVTTSVEPVPPPQPSTPGSRSEAPPTPPPASERISSFEEAVRRKQQ